MAREGALDVSSRKGTPQDVLLRGENVPLRLIAYRDALGNNIACDGVPRRLIA